MSSGDWEAKKRPFSALRLPPEVSEVLLFWIASPVTFYRSFGLTPVFGSLRFDSIHLSFARVRLLLQYAVVTKHVVE